MDVRAPAAPEQEIKERYESRPKRSKKRIRGRQYNGGRKRGRKKKREEHDLTGPTDAPRDPILNKSCARSVAGGTQRIRSSFRKEDRIIPGGKQRNRVMVDP